MRPDVPDVRRPALGRGEDMDEPLADSSLLPTFALCHAARQRVKVAIGGDGADELFAGYINFPVNRFANGLARVPSWTGRAARRLLSGVPANSSYMRFQVMGSDHFMIRFA